MERVLEKSQRAERWVRCHADVLYRHALFRVPEPGIAEDLVQETFLSAWKSPARDQPRDESAERSWLFGIMRHKLADYYRNRSQDQMPCDPAALADLEAAQFATGACGLHWARTSTPGAWCNTDEALQQREFFEVLQKCTYRLPNQVRQAFLLRELDGCGTREICDLLGISMSNLFVMLHRARLALRRCLEVNWFGRTRR
jgi:RNA polymerase sigma-70 factor (ECF subfamily)